MSLKNIKMIIAVLPRGLGEKAQELISNDRASYILMGKGTADTSIKEIFGFGDSEKDVFITFEESDKSSELLAKLNEKFKLYKKNGGIAFSVPLKSVGGLISYKSLVSLNKEKSK